MRVDVKKYLLFGPWSSRDSFFSKAQSLGIAEFISKKPEPLERPQEIQTYIEALHILRSRVSVKQAIPYDYHSAIVLARLVVEQNEELERIKEKLRILEKEIARVQIFGKFSVPELQYVEQISGRKIQFFFAKNIEDLPAIHREEVTYVGTAYGLHYFVSINKEPTSYEGLIEMKIEQSLNELNEEHAYATRRVDELEDELAMLSHHKKELKHGLAEASNHYHLFKSKERVEAQLEGGLFTVEAWIPQNKNKEFQELISQENVSIEPILIEDKDRIPTYLENKDVGRIGEDLVSIYDTPSHTDRDPSLWVFFSFVVFFSMIIADAGYGLILLGLSGYLFYKFKNKTGLVRRLIRLTFALSIGCIIWGILATSFLGIELAPNSKWREYSFITWMVKKKATYLMNHRNDNSYQELVKEYPQTSQMQTPEQLISIKREKNKQISYPIFETLQDSVFMELVIFIGTIHLIISFLRYLDKNWSGLGWVIFMVGAYLYFPTIVKAISLIHYIFGIPVKEGAQIGYILIWIGLGLAVVLALIQKKLKGLAEIMHVIQIFADAMSYLRIYALSLAGIIMASTFNHIGNSVPLYIGIFIILIGHTINFTLAIMGGIIHGLRLNFIEWYHYSFEGGGKAFKPLSLIKIE